MKDHDNPTPAAPQPQPPEPTSESSSATDGIDRRNFLSCMAWAGTGLLWTLSGGVPISKLFAATAHAAGGPAAAQKQSGFSFVQISDSHIGFNKAANQDVTGTLKLAIDKINALHTSPDLLLHTGDITHSSKAAEFDTAHQMVNTARAGQSFYVPGEHDTTTDDGTLYRERFGKGTLGSGWYSFDHKGVHFIGLNNCLQIDALGGLGPEQLAWLKKDLASLSASTPIIVFAHIPLWMVYPEWGWGTQDNVAFHTATSTAFPQPAPGMAPSAGPMVVPAGGLRSVLGITEVRCIARQSQLAIVDSSLAENV